MNELPPDLADILRAARGAHDPSADDEARVLRAVYATTGVLGGVALGGGAAGAGANGGAATTAGALSVAKAGGAGAAGAALKGAGAVAGAKAAGMGLASKLIAGALVLAGAGGGYATLRGHGALEAPATAVAAPSREAAPTRSELEPAEAARAPEVEARSPAVDNTHSAAAPTPSLATAEAAEAPTHARRQHAHAAHAERADGHAAELGLIRATQAALRDGQAARALELLREHRARFPAGILSEERTGLEAIAHCILGHTDEGQRAARSLAARAPGSPLLERVRAACGDAP
jgi:hypothetical protein